MKSIKWGIFGTGKAATMFVNGLKTLPFTEVCAVGSWRKEDAKLFANKYNIPNVYSSYEELVKNNNIDVVYIATPNSFHKDNCLLCLENNLNILCEKPFALNYTEANEVISLARKNNLFCMEAIWTNFIPAMKYVKNILLNKSIGDIRLINIDLGFQNKIDLNNRLFNKKLGGGVLLDLGVYALSFVCQVLGIPTQIKYISTDNNSGIDVQSNILLEFNNSEQANISLSLINNLRNEALIIGERGQIKIHKEFIRPHKLTLMKYPYFNSEQAQAIDKDSNLLKIIKKIPFLYSLALRFDDINIPVLKQEGKKIFIPFKGNGYNYEALEVNNCLREGKKESEYAKLNNTLEVMKIIDSIKSSILTSS